MATKIKLTAVYEPDENGWTHGHLVELPGVITAAPTLAEAKEMLRDALAEYLAALGSAPDAIAPGAESEELELRIAS
jgi:predicted RNase H-like HicB family nuclease